MSKDAFQPRSLSGIRVLDLTRVLAGPTCTQLLGDLGAEVIKIEKPGTGDDTRAWGPPYVAGPDGPTDLSGYFLCANRNKRSVAVDLATDAGAEVIRSLAERSDVVVENYKPGDLARRGLAYDDLSRLNPGLVWCSITGFGVDGPYSNRSGYDFLVQAMGGLMSITGEADGEPVKVGVGVADVMCGMYATVGVLAALRHREATGEGQFLEVSLYDSQIAWLVNAATNHLLSGREPGRLGNRHPNIAPYQTYPALDGRLVVAVGNDTQFARFARIAGRPELADDDRFRTNSDRVAHVDELEAEVGPSLLADTVAGWVGKLTEAGVPSGPVASVPEALRDPHTLARGMVIDMARPDGRGTLKLLGNPLKFGVTPVAYDRAPPSLDADRAAVLEEVLGLSPEQMDELAQAGAFGSSSGS